MVTTVVALAVAVAVLGAAVVVLAVTVRCRNRQLTTVLRHTFTTIGVAEGYLRLLRETGSVAAVDTTKRRTP